MMVGLNAAACLVDEVIAILALLIRHCRQYLLVKILHRLGMTV